MIRSGPPHRPFLCKGCLYFSPNFLIGDRFPALGFHATSTVTQGPVCPPEVFLHSSRAFQALCQFLLGNPPFFAIIALNPIAFPRFGPLPLGDFHFLGAPPFRAGFNHLFSDPLGLFFSFFFTRLSAALPLRVRCILYFPLSRLRPSPSFGKFLLFPSFFRTCGNFRPPRRPLPLADFCRRSG